MKILFVSLYPTDPEIKALPKNFYLNFQWGPQGFWGAVEKGYLFSGSLGALLIILGELGSKLLLGIKGALPKSKKNKYQASILFNSLKFCWPPDPHIYQCNFFPISLPELLRHSICIQHTI